MNTQLKLVSFDDNLKKCTKCGQTKLKTEFNRNKRDGLFCWCKKCFGIHAKSWRSKNKERETHNRKSWRLKNPEKVKRTNLEFSWKKRGILNADGSFFKTHDFQVLLAQQQGKCEICDKDFLGKKGLVVDHNHETGIVRWLLCNNCNIILGMAKDDPIILRKAALALESKKG